MKGYGLYNVPIVMGIAGLDGSSANPEGSNDPGSFSSRLTPAQRMGLQRAGDLTPPGTSNQLGASKAQDVLKNFLGLYGTNRNAYDGMRAALAEAGYYGADSVQRVLGRAAGEWDATAMRTAMVGYKNYTSTTTQPLTFDDWLRGPGRDNSAANTSGGAGYGGTGGGGQVSLTDPAYLTMYAQRAAQASLGRSLTADQLQSFIDSFHNAEQTSQTSGAAKVTGTDARSEAIQNIQQNYLGEEQQHSAKGYMNAMLDMFLPSASQRSAINVDPNAVSY
jgi:hypothetical protein